MSPEGGANQHVGNNCFYICPCLAHRRSVGRPEDLVIGLHPVEDVAEGEAGAEEDGEEDGEAGTVGHHLTPPTQKAEIRLVWVGQQFGNFEQMLPSAV